MAALAARALQLLLPPTETNAPYSMPFGPPVVFVGGDSLEVGRRLMLPADAQLSRVHARLRVVEQANGSLAMQVSNPTEKCVMRYCFCTQARAAPRHNHTWQVFAPVGTAGDVVELAVGDSLQLLAKKSVLMVQHAAVRTSPHFGESAAATAAAAPVTALPSNAAAAPRLLLSGGPPPPLLRRAAPLAVVDAAAVTLPAADAPIEAIDDDTELLYPPAAAVVPRALSPPAASYGAAAASASPELELLPFIVASQDAKTPFMDGARSGGRGRAAASRGDEGGGVAGGCSPHFASSAVASSAAGRGASGLRSSTASRSNIDAAWVRGPSTGGAPGPIIRSNTLLGRFCEERQVSTGAKKRRGQHDAGAATAAASPLRVSPRRSSSRIHTTSATILATRNTELWAAVAVAVAAEVHRKR